MGRAAPWWPASSSWVGARSPVWSAGRAIWAPGLEEADVSLRVARVFLVIYILVGAYVAWVHHYLSPGILRDIAEALLAIFLWFLVLLGVNLHLAR